MIEQEFNRVRHSVLLATGKAPVTIKAAPRLHDDLLEEVARGSRISMLNFPRPYRGGTEWCGIPVQINPYLPSDMAVMLDSSGEIVGVIQV